MGVNTNWVKISDSQIVEVDATESRSSGDVDFYDERNQRVERRGRNYPVQILQRPSELKSSRFHFE